MLNEESALSSSASEHTQLEEMLTTNSGSADDVRVVTHACHTTTGEHPKVIEYLAYALTLRPIWRMNKIAYRP